MEEEIEIYEEKKPEKDWYFSLGVFQMIMCLILALLLIFSFRTGAGKLSEGYSYLMQNSWTKEDVSDCIDVVKGFVSGFNNG